MSIEKRIHFVRQMIKESLESERVKNVITRFPPEPNGYLHIGHARAIYLNFSMAEEFSGSCNLRFDDTNPLTEEQKYIEGIKEDVRWLGFSWAEPTHYTSDYYERLFEYALELIHKGLAYVDSLSIDEIRQYRGTLTEPGKDSPYRTRSIEENLELFNKMREGAFADGEHVLRARIDMKSPNLNLRDPVLYRIKHATHPKTGDKWCLYPMYDYAHPLSDAIEHVSHSLCSLEFQDHRPLYDWLVENTSVEGTPKQTEFSRLNVSHTITSKRKLRALVENKLVDGWDDPRMPTLKGLRNLGVPAEAIRNFCEMTGISKSDSITDLSLLEECIRDVYNQKATRAFGILSPLKVVITNYPEETEEELSIAKHPNEESFGKRIVPFSKYLYIDRDDFMEEPVGKFFRLTKGKEVRLRGAYVIKCDEVIKNEQGEITEIYCTYDKETLGKKPEGRKVKGVIHWLPFEQAKSCSVSLFDRLFTIEDPAKEEHFLDYLNPNSKQEQKALVEPSLLDADIGDVFQFERVGYFILKSKAPLSFYRTVNLKDLWQKR